MTNSIRLIAQYLGFFVMAFLLWFVTAQLTQAANIINYSDTISDSNPGDYANHDFKFQLNTAAPPGAQFVVDFPAGFSVLSSSTIFSTRNVQMFVDGVSRSATTSASAVDDGVAIVTGDGGSVTYTLNSSTGISSGSQVRLLIGNNTETSVNFYYEYSTSTGTTTLPGDVEPIQNTTATGTQSIPLTMTGGAGANIDFLIAIIDNISIPNVDTTEEIPPYRFNGLPAGEIGGTTLSVEISLETDELAICRLSEVEGRTYAEMGAANNFDVTGQIFHTNVVTVVPESINTYYVKCIDDEGNFNTVDYIISFYAPQPPSGQPNAEGEVEGDGTGSGNNGSGAGSGGGGQEGGEEGEASDTGSASGSSGGSGGGGGGGSGGGSGNDGGGGFESSDGPYESGDGRVIISGYAFPGSRVTALVDGASVDTVRAGNSGSYEIVIDEIARGGYTFGVYATGDDGVKSSTYSTAFTVSGARASGLSNINLSPSISVSPDPVDPGQTLTVSGYALEDSTITIENQKQGSSVTKKTFTATSDSSGYWETTIDTSGFSNGTYQIKAKSIQNSGLGISTNFSNDVLYGVGEAANRPLNPDLNTDGSVNLTDFSILLFWWGGDGGVSDPPADINQDGTVSLTDFSILLFNWTG